MKNKLKYIVAALTGSVILFSACTDSFEEKNSDPSALSDSQKEIDYGNLRIPLKVIQQGIYFNYDWGYGKNWPYQIMQNLTSDMYSGYTHTHKSFNSGSYTSDYNMLDNWTSSMWVNTYAYAAPYVLRLEEAANTKYPGFMGVAKIIKVEMMHRITDTYGPIIYTHFGELKTGSIPDTQKDTYYAFFADLDNAVKMLDAHINSGVADYAKEVGTEDIMTGSHANYQQWIKFANSLRLRLAMRIATADESKAKEEALKALSNKYGVLESATDIIAISTSKGFTNPLGEINRSWKQTSMNANMESILCGYNDPRLPKYFEPATKSICEGEYRGIRQGTCFTHENYVDLSCLTVNQSTDALLMTAAEVWFLRAEAALRKWTSENVEANYRKGVETSFAQWGATGVDAYLASNSVPRNFVDLLDPTNNIAAVSKISPKWSDTSTDEQKLERIITQKWIAVYPEGCEAWAEQRRTGYPKLFPVKVNNSGGKIDTNIMIRRLNYPKDLSGNATEQYNALLKCLGGDNTGGVRLWWDTGSNFINKSK